MIWAPVLAYFLGVGSVLMAAWTRLRIEEWRSRQQIVALRHQPIAMSSTTVVQILKRGPKPVPPDEVA